MAILLDGTLGITTPDLTDTSLTSGRVVYAGASGNLTGSTALTFDGTNLALTQSGNPTMTVKTTGAGNNPLYRLQADTNYWEILGVFSDANDTLRIRYNGADKMILNRDGTMALAGGDSDATGVGITFPATQSASSNANTLDDYEEGSWTPSIGGTATYNGRYGFYTRIGNVVTCQFSIQVNVIGTGSVSSISGLPFTAISIVGAEQSGSTSYFSNSNTSVTYLSFYSNQNNTTLSVIGTSAAATGVTDPFSFFKNGANLYGTITYRVN
jgi:hypothetical protein